MVEVYLESIYFRRYFPAFGLSNVDSMDCRVREIIYPRYFSIRLRFRSVVRKGCLPQNLLYPLLNTLSHLDLCTYSSSHVTKLLNVLV